MPGNILDLIRCCQQKPFGFQNNLFIDQVCGRLTDRCVGDGIQLIDRQICHLGISGDAFDLGDVCIRAALLALRNAAVCRWER